MASDKFQKRCFSSDPLQPFAAGILLIALLCSYTVNVQGGVVGPPAVRGRNLDITGISGTYEDYESTPQLLSVCSQQLSVDVVAR